MVSTSISTIIRRRNRSRQRCSQDSNRHSAFFSGRVTKNRLPKSPTTLDPYRYAKPDKKGRLVVPSSAAPVVRRDWILTNLATSRWTRLDPDGLKKALAEPVILAGEQPVEFKAPHFTWQVRRQLESILGSADAVDTGGYKVITTLDWSGQQLAEKWMTAAVIAPNLSYTVSQKLLRELKIPLNDRRWIAALRGKEIEEVPLRHQRDELRLGRQMRKIGDRQWCVAKLSGELEDLLVRKLQKLIEPAKFVHHLQCRGMNSVAAEVAKEVGMLLEHRHVDALPGEQQPQHDAGRTTTGDRHRRRLGHADPRWRFMS